jgi:hypothetical protein
VNDYFWPAYLFAAALFFSASMVFIGAYGAYAIARIMFAMDEDR